MTEWWEPGRPVAIRYGRYDTTRWVFTGNVIRDDAEELAVWLRPGAPTIESRTADGRTVDVLTREELLQRTERVPTPSSWYSEAAVFVFPAGRPWSVWMFYNPDGSLHRWKVNLERPCTRWLDADGNAYVDTSDRSLDVLAFPDGTWRYKDEADFGEKKLDVPGYWGAELAAEVRAHAVEAIALIEARAETFDGRYTRDLPVDDDWQVPVLADSWRSPHTNWP